MAMTNLGYSKTKAFPDVACRLRRRWRSSRRPTSLGSHLSLLPYSATARMHATCTARTFSGTTPYALVCDRRLASAALADFMHRLWCSVNVRCASIQTPSHRDAGGLNRMDPFPTLFFAVSSGRRCSLWPRLHLNSAPSVFAASNCSSRLPAPSAKTLVSV